MPFNGEVQFKVADLLFCHTELSVLNIDALLDLWAQSFEDFDPPQCAPFTNHEDLYATIDSSTLGDIPWQCLVTQIPDDTNKHFPSWMQTQYKVWYCDPKEVVSTMLSNLDFDRQFDLCPYIDLDTYGKH
jgi:hypothetical protein